MEDDNFREGESEDTFRDYDYYDNYDEMCDRREEYVDRRFE